VQADTIVPSPGDPQSLNRYSYVLNSPLNYRDPSGHAYDAGGAWAGEAPPFVVWLPLILNGGSAPAPLNAPDYLDHTDIGFEFVNGAWDAGGALLASGPVDVIQVGTCYRIYGTHPQVTALGWNPYVRRVLPQNAPQLLANGQGLAGVLNSGMAAMTSPWTSADLLINAGIDFHRLRTGDYDVAHYRAALTVDTGATLGTALIAGGLAGAVAGGLIGTGVAPVLGSVIGIVGGAAVGVGITWWLNYVEVADGMSPKDYTIEKVSNLYDTWGWGN
jgi:hypothetical protein